VRTFRRYHADKGHAWARVAGRKIAKTFVEDRSPLQINIGWTQRAQILVVFEDASGAPVPFGVFDEAVTEVERMLMLGAFYGFAKTQGGVEQLAAAAAARASAAAHDAEEGRALHQARSVGAGEGGRLRSVVRSVRDMVTPHASPRAAAAQGSPNAADASKTASAASSARSLGGGHSVPASPTVKPSSAPRPKAVFFADEPGAEAASSSSR